MWYHNQFFVLCNLLWFSSKLCIAFCKLGWLTAEWCITILFIFLIYLFFGNKNCSLAFSNSNFLSQSITFSLYISYSSNDAMTCLSSLAYFVLNTVKFKAKTLYNCSWGNNMFRYLWWFSCSLRSICIKLSLTLCPHKARCTIWCVSMKSGYDFLIGIL